MPANKCGACGTNIMNALYMECSNIKCSKRYDLKCLNIELDTFKTFTQVHRKKWRCPECTSCTPKKDNTETPIRTSLSMLHKSSSPVDTINEQRGGQLHYSPNTTVSDSQLLDELRQMRTEILVRLECQANVLAQMQYQFCETKGELEKLSGMMKVLEAKVDAQTKPDVSYRDIAMGTPQTHIAMLSLLPEQQQAAQPSKKKIGKRPVAEESHVEVTSKPTTSTASNDPSTNTVTATKGGQYKSDKRGNSVRVGNNNTIMTIQGTERKRHVHVWRLHPETTVEAMTDYVSSVCGPNVPIKVEKIKHKTERDYSSFIIGVPEKMFEKLNQPEVWPINAQFSEWIWFRNSRTKGAIA